MVGNVRIMIVDNDSSRADSIAELLKKHENIEVISVVSSRETAIKQIGTKPEILILNPIVLKQHTLSRFLHSVQEKSSGTRVMLLFTVNPPDDQLISDIKNGIRGYIKVSDPPAVIAKAVLSVSSGEIWAERRLLELALSKPMLLPETLQANIPGLTPLTNRETEMLTMVLQGATNREIADKSSISERTVKTHLYRVYKKLKVKSRTKAIALLSHS